MFSKLFVLIYLLLVQSSLSQNIIVNPEQAVEIICSKDYEKIEPNEFNLDSVGTNIIRTLFSDKANHPDRISKKRYLENPILTPFEKEFLSNLYQSLKDPKKRKEVYLLAKEDSLLIFGRSTSMTPGLWSFSAVDSTIASNPYYQFFIFNLRMSQNSTPQVVANNFVTSGPYGATSTVAKPKTLIYDPVFTVGIPKVCLYNNDTIKLPLILLGRDFISYPNNKLLLDNVLKSSGYCDSTSLSLLVYLDAFSDYGPKEFHPTPCQDLNLFKNKTCYQFASGNGTKYIATINKSYKISYALIEEPHNLMSHVKSVFYARYHESDSEVTFKSKRGRKFIYEIEVRDYLTRQRKSYKAVYKRGRITYNLIKQN